MQIKRWMQGLGIVYTLLLLAICAPGWKMIRSGDQVQSTVKQIDGKQTVEQKEKGEQETETRGKEKPKIALTFDDGPSAVYTPVLLDGLEKRGVKATFFLIGKNIEAGENAEIVKREQDAGHLIGNHTYNHVEITKLDDESAYQELKRTNEVIEGITGETVEFMRPPFGAWQKTLEKKIHVLPVMWTVDPLDWATENADEIVNKVVTEVEENDIILLHDCYDSSVKAALRIVDLLQAEGYEFVTVDELLVN